ncbi:hypothetical protein CBR_g29304 [Chara braunii]|uniref:CCHC-type domain-containing protein n=1 Tax=Chara braunii TaxID=69332 RepID=A0A388LAP4_CHABU|nr:hypothetical protein CBR_g29304 [Chara braunii]|eukprot:GBG79253.1 hypothetical protein CBR_g29304 [Chara braunii]
MERGSGGAPQDTRKCYKCGEGGHFIHDCAEYWQVKALGRAFVPSAQTAAPARTGRTNAIGVNSMVRRSRSMESARERSEAREDMNTLMRDYFMQMAEERRLRVEREAEETRRRREEEERRLRESKRVQRQEEHMRLEEEQDAKLLRIVRSEMRKDRDDERERYERKEKAVARTGSRNEAAQAEKERLRRLIAAKSIGPDAEEEDEELLALRMMTINLNIAEKQKRGPEMAVGNNPPLVTPEKRSNLKLTEKSKTRIEQLRSDLTTDTGTTSTPGRIDLSLKHISASCGIGGKEKFEEECQDFYDALTIDEIKEAWRREKVAYGNRELAIKRLVIRRSAVAYDPSNIPLPSTPRTKTRSDRGVIIREAKKEDDIPAPSDSEASYSEDESD